MNLRQRVADRSKPSLVIQPITLADPALVEIAGFAGVEAVLLDCEHGMIGTETVRSMFAHAAAAGIAAVFRPTSFDASGCRQALDQGWLVPAVGCPAACASGAGLHAAGGLTRIGVLHDGVLAHHHTGHVHAFVGQHFRAGHRDTVTQKTVDSAGACKMASRIDHWSGGFSVVFAAFYKPREYIQMYFAITGAIFSGLGCAIIGGLYWRYGGTLAA
jgi:hypothetical protein